MSAPTSNSESGVPATHHRAMYKGMMHFGFVYGLPIGGAIAVLVAVLLMNAGLITSFVVAFFTWLGLLGLSKTFFVH